MVLCFHLVRPRPWTFVFLPLPPYRITCLLSPASFLPVCLAVSALSLGVAMARFLAFLSLLLLGLLPTCQPFLIVPASSTPRGPTPLHSTNDPELLPDLTHDDISR